MVKCGVKTPREVAILSPGSNGEAVVKCSREKLRRQAIGKRTQAIGKLASHRGELDTKSLIFNSPRHNQVANSPATWFLCREFTTRQSPVNSPQREHRKALQILQRRMQRILRDAKRANSPTLPLQLLARFLSAPTTASPLLHHSFTLRGFRQLHYCKATNSPWLESRNFLHHHIAVFPLIVSSWPNS
jgi:hypothetical protein